MLTQAPSPHPFTMTPWEIIPLVIVLSLCVLVLFLMWPMDEIPLATPTDEPERRAVLPSCPAPFDWSTDPWYAS